MDREVLAAFQERVLAAPEQFIGESESLTADTRNFVKYVFDFGAQFNSKAEEIALKELYIDGFDSDQIWEQMDLLNKPLLAKVSDCIRSFTKNSAHIKLCNDHRKQSAKLVSSPMSTDQEYSEVGADTSDESDDEIESGNAESGIIPIDATSMEDQDRTEKGQQAPTFFDWDEMDLAAEDMEKNHDEVDEDISGDSASDQSSDDDETEDIFKYNDFFDDGKHSENTRDTDGSRTKHSISKEEVSTESTPNVDGSGHNQGSNRKDANREDDDACAERGILMSSHQNRQMNLNKQIGQLENDAIREKPWQLQGEVHSSLRPENSLLEAVLEYDRPVINPPAITAESSLKMEELIKQRILEDQFDDVVGQAPSDDLDKTHKVVDVPTEQSKEGLGDIYEREYLKTVSGNGIDPESQKDQDEIAVMYERLCWKLDALSNFQFTPKPAVKELQVNPAVPAIALEEMIPIGISDANLKAPEEVFEKKRKRGEVIPLSKDEMTQKERKAARGASKRARQKHRKELAASQIATAKTDPKMKEKLERMNMIQSMRDAKNVIDGSGIKSSDSGHLTNSKAFFTKLEHEKNINRSKAGL
uniref:U3 small nucleolar ribonucleoprotein protein MPP10 n=1 Tax=Albugo laibachii Nc14 TaxID=890382 RepID=F0WEH9_9STRA|nr:U3 small nucleolar ribonucleoprotein putative [Albugo laibachii Nc14]|eukprot:CCA19611.1 U3 small nucleolar ribonucleoprotein putative [Albugo laibachii Nc14]